MPAHRIGERDSRRGCRIASQGPLEESASAVALVGRAVGQAGTRAARQQQDLEGPHGPEGNDRQPVRVRDDDALALRAASGGVVEQQRPAVLGEVGRCCSSSRADKVGQRGRAPRPGRADAGWSAHHARPLFSNTCTQRYAPPSSARLLRPDVDHAPNVAAAAISGRVRSWRGEKQITRQVPRTPSARNSGCAASVRLGRVRQQRREVVGEDEGALVVGVALAARSLVAGA